MWKAKFDIDSPVSGWGAHKFMTEETPETQGYQGEAKAAKFREVRNFWGDPVKSAEYKKRQLKWGASYKRDCKKCGCPLGFGLTHDGKVIPLDLRAPVYCVTGEVYRLGEEGTGVVRTHLAYPSHFSTCPHASEFSGSNK